MRSVASAVDFGAQPFTVNLGNVGGCGGPGGGYVTSLSSYANWGEPHSAVVG